MPDQLRDRFDAFRSAVERSDAAGLHDVRVRRTRRARNRVVAGSAATVAALALAGVVVLPQLTPEPSTSAGGAEVLTENDTSRDSDAGSAGDAGAEQAESTESGADEQPADEDGSAGPFAVTVDSLLTWEEILAVGETGSGPLPFGASLVFPPLCEAGTSYGQYSMPIVVYSAAWVLSDSRLDQAVVEYESDQQAADALARLVGDSQECPVYDEFAAVQYVGTDSAVGEDVAYFDLQLADRQDGSLSIAEITVTRVANVLIEVVLTPDGATVADADSRSRALAEAAVSRIVAIG